MKPLSDPVGAGYVASLPRPLAGKWLGILKEVTPGIARVALLINPDTAILRGTFYSKEFEAARRRETSCHCMGKVEMPKLAYLRYADAIACKTRVLLIASATVRFIGIAILWVPIANAPAGFVQRS